jgi:hypothetical protein
VLAFYTESFYTRKLSHTEAFIYTEKAWHREAFNFPLGVKAPLCKDSSV